MVTKFRATLALAALVLAPSVALADGPEVHDAYIRSSGGTGSAAAFMMIHNHGETGDRLIGAASPAAARVELHTHEEDANGVMKMIHIEEGFDLPAGGEIPMQRGGAHVMFMGLTEPLEDGDTVPLTLIFSSGELALEVPVDNARAAEHGATHGGTSASGHGDHSGHGDMKAPSN